MVCICFLQKNFTTSISHCCFFCSSPPVASVSRDWEFRWGRGKPLFLEMSLYIFWIKWSQEDLIIQSVSMTFHFPGVFGLGSGIYSEFSWWQIVLLSLVTVSNCCRGKYWQEKKTEELNWKCKRVDWVWKYNSLLLTKTTLWTTP